MVSPFTVWVGTVDIKVDVRIVAATNQNLEAAVKEGRLREDLFHRSANFSCGCLRCASGLRMLWPWREYFLRLKAPRKTFSSRLFPRFLLTHGRANIRELRNLVGTHRQMESSVLHNRFSSSPQAQRSTRRAAAFRSTASMAREQSRSMEEQMIIKALERTRTPGAPWRPSNSVFARTLSRQLKDYNINFAPGESSASLGFISSEHQKIPSRARVQIAVTIKHSQGQETQVQGVNLRLAAWVWMV